MLHFALTSVLMQLHTRESSMDLLLFSSICLLSSSISYPLCQDPDIPLLCCKYYDVIMQLFFMLLDYM